MFVADHHTMEQLHKLIDALPEKRVWQRVQSAVIAKQE